VCLLCFRPMSRTQYSPIVTKPGSHWSGRVEKCAPVRKTVALTLGERVLSTLCRAGFRAARRHRSSRWRRPRSCRTYLLPTVTTRQSLVRPLQHCALLLSRPQRPSSTVPNHWEQCATMPSHAALTSPQSYHEFHLPRIISTFPKHYPPSRNAIHLPKTRSTFPKHYSPSQINHQVS
jgi:hypothetical protein